MHEVSQFSGQLYEVRIRGMQVYTTRDQCMRCNGCMREVYYMGVVDVGH